MNYGSTRNNGRLAGDREASSMRSAVHGAECPYVKMTSRPDGKRRHVSVFVRPNQVNYSTELTDDSFGKFPTEMFVLFSLSIVLQRNSYI